MLRRLFILLFIALSTNVVAQQVAITPVKSTEKKEPEIDYKLIGAPMPSIRVILYQDSVANSKAAKIKDSLLNSGRKKARRHERKEEGKLVLTNEDVDNGANLFVMLFNPTCSHCQDETAILKNNISLFRKSKVVMMASPVAKPYLPDFVNMLHMLDYPVFSVGVDSAGYQQNTYMYLALPQINIYDHDRKLIKVFNGEIEIDSLKKYIE